MPKKKAKAIADAADMVVDGFAVSKHELGVILQDGAKVARNDG